MGYKLYINEAKRQLTDSNVYRLLERDPLPDIKKKIEMIVKKALEDELIDTALSEFLLVKLPKTPLLYLLPKIHNRYKPPRDMNSLWKGISLKQYLNFLG